VCHICVFTNALQIITIRFRSNVALVLFIIEMSGKDELQYGTGNNTYE